MDSFNENLLGLLTWVAGIGIFFAISVTPGNQDALAILSGVLLGLGGALMILARRQHRNT